MNQSLITLENKSLRLSIHPQGAELQSVKDKKDETEYMWQADPTVWGRHAPILFPIVGRLKDNSYSWKGQSYQMKQHGFARDRVFDVDNHDGTKVSFTFKADSETCQLYPFDFKLIIQYTLQARRLSISYEVYNEGNELMPFTIGAHPGFSCPILEGEKLDDYVVEFDQEEYAVKHLLDDGLFNGSMKPILKHESRLPIDAHSFDEDAIVFPQPKR